LQRIFCSTYTAARNRPNLTSLQELAVPRTNRSKLAASIRKKLQRIPKDELLPMPHRLGAGRVTAAEREEYRQRRETYLAKNRRYLDQFALPKPDVLQQGWNLLDLILPAAPNRSDQEKTCLVLLTALFVRAGMEGRRVSYNDVFDTLARAYSDHFIASPARMARDMRPLTAKFARRDLLLNDVDVNRLWRFMVRTWPRKKSGRCPYAVEHVRTGSAYYLEIELKTGRHVDDFVSFLRGLGQGLCSTRGVRLKFIGEKPCKSKFKPEDRTKTRYCAEVPYNVVEIGQISRDLLNIQSRAQLLFDIDAFKRDYQKAEKKRESLRRSILKKYRIDAEQSELSRKRKSGAGKRTKAARDNSDGEYWSPRDETLYYRSIERGLRLAKPKPGSRIAKMAKEKRDRKPEEWTERPNRFQRWRKRNGLKRLAQRKPSEARIAEAAVATWPWRQAVRADLAAFDRARQLVRTYRAAYDQVRSKTGIKPIGCEFVRLINRRYQPLHMWPSYVSDKILPAEDLHNPAQQLELDDEIDDVEQEAKDPESLLARTYRHRWFKVEDPDSRKPVKLIHRDISSSQTQIVATLLGMEELENLTMASGTTVPFKEWLADFAFKRHEESFRRKRLLAWRLAQQRGEELAEPVKAAKARKKSRKSKAAEPEHIFSLRVVREKTHRLKNYTGKTDARLQNLCKTLWMTASYGSDPRKVNQLHRNDPATFGPGWSDKDAHALLNAINDRFPEMKSFLKACQYMANRVAKRRPLAGVELIDPSDRSVIRWNPVDRSDRALSNNGHKLMLSLPTANNVKDRFPSGRKYPVDAGRLRRMMAPCVVHMLDAYFSTLVMRQLKQRGVRNFIGIHDCWYLPEKVKSRGRMRDGDEVLVQAIDSAAAEWYRGLKPVYAALLTYVKGKRDFKSLIERAEQRWEKRVSEGYVPKFLSKAG
jgi:hypothetical protein